MDYSTLSDRCRLGLVDGIKLLLRWAEKAGEKVDIFWHDDHLIKMAAIYGGVDTVKVLIEYYNEHNLKDLDPESDAYLHARQPLVDAMQRTQDSTTKVFLMC